MSRSHVFLAPFKEEGAANFLFFAPGELKGGTVWLFVCSSDLAEEKAEKNVIIAHGIKPCVQACFRQQKAC